MVRSVNSQMVIAYWLIGREIVEEEQKGQVRAEYGRRLIAELANGLPEIGHPLGDQSALLPSGRTWLYNGYCKRTS